MLYQHEGKQSFRKLFVGNKNTVFLTYLALNQAKMQQGWPVWANSF